MNALLEQLRRALRKQKRTADAGWLGRIFQLVDRGGDTPVARLERANRRISQVVTLLGLWLLVAFGGGIWSVLNVEDVRKYAEGNLLRKQRMETRRGHIVDRKGVTLATSLRQAAISCNPRWIVPAGTSADHDGWRNPALRTAVKELLDGVNDALALHVPFKDFRTQWAEHLAKVTGLPLEPLLDRVHRDTSFVYLAKELDEAQIEAIRAEQEKGRLLGVTIEEDYRRFYPGGTLAGPLVGRPNQTGSIEASFDALLSGQVVDVSTYKDSTAKPLFMDGTPEPQRFAGRSLQLTIDEKIQAVAEHHLAAAVTEFDADFGITMVLDIETSELLAVAVAPSLDPNENKIQNRFGQHNIALENQYEPGSTFKVFNLAIGLQEKVTTLTEVIQAGASLVVGNKVIKDDHPHAFVTGKQSLQVSSNIANAKIAMRVEREKYYKYLRDLGFGRRVDLGIIGESSGQLAHPDRWSKVQFANIAFGQGIAATPLQMVTAFAAIGRGGVFKRPLLVKAELGPDGTPVRNYEAEEGRRVFDEAVAKQVLEAMHSVTQPRVPGDPNSMQGTATKARLPNYSIGGKTGTAQQAENGRYSDTHWVGSFIAVTPIEKPRLVILTTIDTPKKYDAGLGKIVRYGGIVAAPVVREVARFALPYLGVPLSPGAPYLDKDDPEKARQKDLARGAQTKSALVASVAPADPAGDAAAPSDAPAVVAPASEPAAPLAHGQVRVPDVVGKPMRAARTLLAANKLVLASQGSGLAAKQSPAAGSVVAEATAVTVEFKRLSEVVARPKLQAAVEPGQSPATAAAPAPPAATAKNSPIGQTAAKAGAPARKAGAAAAAPVPQPTAGTASHGPSKPAAKQSPGLPTGKPAATAASKAKATSASAPRSAPVHKPAVQKAAAPKLQPARTPLPKASGKATAPARTGGTP